MSNLENNQYSFLELLDKVGIKIPIIQRDYAQGRESAKTIREKFITNLYDVLSTNEKKINLDFVYGTIKDGYLIPLDGQQRLTTLFLLHYYLLNDKKEQLQKFTYETRVSSRKFCSLLIEKGIDKKSENISKTIKNQTWFFSEWENDPTISAMLNTLDTIQKVSNNERFKNKQISIDDLEKITFSFLNLDDFQLTDELYIKMNARGKPLSDFENFKSKFVENINITDKAKLDNEWMDIFWNLEKENLSSSLDEDKRKKILKSIDDKYLNFFKNITLFFDTSKRPDEINIFEFDYSRENIENIEIILDIISQSQQTEAQAIEKLRSQDKDYNINIFEDFIKENPTYRERARFYALMQFYIKKGDPSENETLFISYMRVNLNIIHNVADSYENFRRLQKFIEQISEKLKSNNFYKNVYNLEVTNFKDEFEEEKTKAHLICQDFKWEKEFIKAENHWYLDGQIGFLIDYAKWNFDDFANLYEFQKYRDRFKALWDFAKGNQENQILIYQALLTKGDYLPKVGQNYTFCNFKPRLEEKDKNWRKVFGKNYFKELLDDKIGTTKNELNRIIDSYLKKYEDCQNRDSKTKYLYTLISNPENIAYCDNLQIRYYDHGKKVYLLKETTMGGTHRELYTHHLFTKYMKDKKFSPFIDAKYHYAKKDSNRCIYFDIDKSKEYNFNKESEQHNFAIDILYKDDEESFKIKFFDRNKKPISEKISKLLLDNNFLLSDKDGFYWYEPKISLCEIEEVNNILLKFTKKFEKFIYPNQT
jgi:hypothetical protein